MKCRRSKTSRGARLRGAGKPARSAPRQATARPAHSTPDTSGAGAPAEILRINGTTRSAIHYAGMVIVGRDASVAGDITATIITVEGHVEGDLHAVQVLRVTSSAHVVGDLYAPRVAVARGARVRGRISTQRALTTAPALDGLGIDCVLSGGS